LDGQDLIKASVKGAKSKTKRERRTQCLENPMHRPDHADLRRTLSFDEPGATKCEVRGILVGNARSGSLEAFIPDPVDLNTVIRGTAASGITADFHGNIYAVDVGSHKPPQIRASRQG